MTVRNIASICNMVSNLLAISVAIDLPAATMLNLVCNDVHGRESPPRTHTISLSLSLCRMQDLYNRDAQYIWL